MGEEIKKADGSDKSENIFLFLSALELRGMDASNQVEKNVIAKLKDLEADFESQIAKWSSDINTLSKDADDSDNGKISTDVQTGNEDQIMVQQIQQKNDYG